MITGIHHVSLLISSEECLNFYKVLGFSESYRKQRANDCIVLLDGYGFQLEVFIDLRHPQKAEGEQEPLGTRHFALRVDNIEDTVEQLGFDHTEIGTDWTGVKYCYLHDPDGNQVALHG